MGGIWECLVNIYRYLLFVDKYLTPVMFQACRKPLTSAVFRVAYYIKLQDDEGETIKLCY